MNMTGLSVTYKFEGKKINRNGGVEMSWGQKKPKLRPKEAECCLNVEDVKGVCCGIQVFPLSLRPPVERTIYVYGTASSKMFNITKLIHHSWCFYKSTKMSQIKHLVCGPFL